MCDALTQIWEEKKKLQNVSAVYDMCCNRYHNTREISTNTLRPQASVDISVETHTGQFALLATRNFSHRWEFFFPVYVYSFFSVICCFAITLHTPHTVAYSNALEVLNDTLLRLHAGEEGDSKKGEYENLWMKKSCWVSNVSLDSAMNKCMRQHIDTRERASTLWRLVSFTWRAASVFYSWNTYVNSLCFFSVFFAKYTILLVSRRSELYCATGNFQFTSSRRLLTRLILFLEMQKKSLSLSYSLRCLSIYTTQVNFHSTKEDSVYF